MNMNGLLSQVKREARLKARALALGVIATVFLLVGLGFLSVALWMVVAVEYGALIAFQVLGGLYVILGVICLLLRPASQGGHQSASDQPGSRPDPSQQPDPLVRMATGFAAGLQAGRAARRNGDDR